MIPITPDPKARNQRRVLLIILFVALALRIVFVLATPVSSAYVDDSGWYIDNGKRLLTNTMTPKDIVPFPPVYSMFTGALTLVLGQDAGILLVRLVQAALGALSCVFMWRIVLKFTSDQTAAIIAALGIALNPIFIIENNTIVSETLFIFLLYWGLSIYVRPTEYSRIRTLAVGGLMGLATLTRAVLVAFPIGLAIHLFLVLPWRRAIGHAALLLGIYAAVVGSWTVYNKVKFDRLVIGGYGASDLLLASAVGYNGSKAIDPTYAQLNDGSVPSGPEREAVAARTVTEMIARDPLGYVARQLKSLGEALLQPHNTVRFPGIGLKESVASWIRDDRSLQGLITIMSDPTFAPKLLLYIFHWSSLALGLIGLILCRKAWKTASPLWGVILYFLLVHFFLLALPRYVFPITPALWVFAGIAAARILARLNRLRKRRTAVATW